MWKNKVFRNNEKLYLIFANLMTEHFMNEIIIIMVIISMFHVQFISATVSEYFRKSSKNDNLSSLLSNLFVQQTFRMSILFLAALNRLELFELIL